MPETIGVATLSGSLNGQNDNLGTANGSLNIEGTTVGTVSIEGSASGIISSEGGATGVLSTEGHGTATLSLRIGQDGQDGFSPSASVSQDGKDGFSPTITIHKDTKTEYILKITDVNGSYLTPNLYPDLEGLQDVVTLVAGKVDKDLSDYVEINPATLNVGQRQNTYLYVDVMNKPRKLSVGTLALQQETNERIAKKLQTVSEVPTRENWKIGDYILLDVVPSKD